MVKTSTTVIREECSLFLTLKEKTVLPKQVKVKIQDSVDRIQGLCMLLSRLLDNLDSLFIEKTLHCTSRKQILSTQEDTCHQGITSNQMLRSFRLSSLIKTETCNRVKNKLTNKVMTIRCMLLTKLMLLLPLITACTTKEAFIRQSIRMPNRMVKSLSKHLAHLLQAFLNSRVQVAVLNSLEGFPNLIILQCMEQCKNLKVQDRPANKILVERVVV